MLVELGDYAPFGASYLLSRPQLSAPSLMHPEIDFNGTVGQPRASFHNLFSVSDNMDLTIGEPLDEHRPQHFAQVENPALELEQEIYVQGSTVLWSRAEYVLKSFDYSGEQQPIQQVLFAWFPIADDVEDVKQDDISAELQRQQRMLCIVFDTYIKIHTESGLETTTHFDFCIGHVVPLDVGLLVSRGHQPPMKKRMRAKLPVKVNSRPSSPAVNFNMTTTAYGSEFCSYFVSVTHPVKGPCPIKIKDVRNGNMPEPVTNPYKLLYATTKSSETGRLPVIVTLNIKENRHYIWTYDRKKDKPPQGTKRKSVITPPGTPTMKKKNLPLAPEPVLSKSPARGRSPAPPSTPGRNTKKKVAVPEPQPYAQFHEDYVSDDDDIDESDLYFSLLDPSEIALRLLWRESLNKVPAKLKGAGRKDVKSKAFLMHDLNGQELICIMNDTLASLQVINLSKATQLLGDCTVFKSPAKCAVPIHATRDGFVDLLFMDNTGALQLFIDACIPRMPIPLADVVDLVDPVYDRFTAVFDNHSHKRYQLNFRPSTSLVRDCLAAIDCATTIYFPKIWMRFLQLCQQHRIEEYESIRVQATEWEAFFISVLSFLRLSKKGFYTGNKTPASSQAAMRETHLQQIKSSNVEYIMNELGFSKASPMSSYDFLLDQNYIQGIPMRWIDQVLGFDSKEVMDGATLADVVRSLHVVYEDYRIKKSMAVHANLLGYLLLQCSVILGNKEWIDYYKMRGLHPSFTVNLKMKDDDVRETIIDPPNIQHCLRQMTPNTSLLSSFGVNTLEPSLSHCRNTYALTIKNLWSLYGAIHSGHSLINRMVTDRISRKDIEILIDAVSLPILEVLEQLKLKPSMDWPKEAYTVIERDDIYKQLSMQLSVCDPNTDTFKLPFQKDSDHPQIMSELMKDYSATPVHKCIYESDVLNMETERLRFGFGGFIEKVRIMLDATRVPDYHLPEMRDLSDDDLAAEHQSQVMLLLQRTLSLSLGRGIYAFATHTPDLTQVLPLEPIVLSAKILPLRTVVAIDETVWSKDHLLWPQFHNGVAAGLRISPSNHINDSWIHFCNPTDLESQHGGLLLAMGLNGTLKKLPLIDWYRFMTEPCELVSVGFILGAAAAYRGTKDIKVTKILSIHIPALLPADSASFNRSNAIKATSLVSMGLLYMNSSDRYMVSVMLKEIGKNAYTDPSLLDPDYEGCGLAAGFALGFIALGVGDNATHLDDLKLRTTLYSLMTGRSHASVKQNSEQESMGSINLDVTSPGATMALGLMYLKTENTYIAQGVDILETRPYLNYVRPDFLLIRVVAKNLIMWNTIEPSDSWIDSQLPDFIVNEDQRYDKEVTKQAMYNIICGACLCLGLRYAGSKHQDAFWVLLNRLDGFIKLLHTHVATPQQHVTKSVVRTCVDVLCTAAAMVMAGTGNRDLLSRLEQLHEHVSADMSYGNHTAVSMSLGLIFMGLGGYTLTTTNEAIAGLLCAFYPFYPTCTDDNRYHLQAFRHLWVLGVDSRWLMPFDVDSKKPCRVPMRLELYQDEATRKVTQIRIEAPTVVPDYKLIKSIHLDGQRYWPLAIDMVPGKYQASIIKSGLIYVKRRQDKKSYEDDPYGKRNITW